MYLLTQHGPTESESFPQQLPLEEMLQWLKKRRTKKFLLFCLYQVTITVNGLYMPFFRV